MATILQQYREKQQSFCSQINSGNLPLEKVIEMQEVNYRICVLETFESFCKTAPITTDNKAMGYHYQLVDAYVRFVLNERKFGARTDADGAKSVRPPMPPLKRWHLTVRSVSQALFRAMTSSIRKQSAITLRRSFPCGCSIVICISTYKEATS